VNSIILCEREGAPKASSNLGSKAIDQGYSYALESPRAARNQTMMGGERLVHGAGVQLGSRLILEL
jgi:hypothetical protein